MEEVTLLIGRGRAAGGYAPIRIAVLDTGIRGDNWYSRCIYGYKDFVDGKEEKIDLTGHGTTSVHLILKLINNVQIYVARVFEGRSAVPETVSAVAKVWAPYVLL